MNATDLYREVKLIEANLGSVERSKRDDYLSTILGAIAASVATLPSEPVVSPTNHWVLQHEANVKRVFSELNEQWVFNIPLALKVARQVYLSRYRRVHDKELIISELALLLPDHVSHLPPEVPKLFAELGEDIKHNLCLNLIPMLSDVLGYNH